MNTRLVEDIADTVLYEGYLLYPYRASALKNQQRFNFGVVVPREANKPEEEERWRVQTECLLCGSLDAIVAVRVRFLHLFESGDSLSPNGWQQAVERELLLDVRIGDVVASPLRHPFEFAAALFGQEPVSGIVDVSAEPLDGAIKLRVVIANLTGIADLSPCDRAGLQKLSLLSTHAILHAKSGGEFVSLTDPPDDLRVAAAACENQGLWPVLAGDEGERDAMLASPIILYDYPRVAPESAGDFFDGTEMDEMLALRVLTLTDEEKAQARITDPRARAILERTEHLSDESMRKLHGILRGLRPIEEP
jgi:hypothetical protein